MSRTKYRPRHRMDKECTWARRYENRRRRRENNQRVRQGFEPKRFRGTQSMMTW